MSERIPSIAHILVVGFHHQKGATVEFSYPPLQEADDNHAEQQSFTNLLPSEWRCLPYLALPDGCHNYEEDSVYFSLPCPETTIMSKSVGGDSSCAVVHGIACCRQLDSKDVLSRDEELTRSTVQKSVCVLSRIPVFGFIEAKLNLVTHAYFNSKDFSEVSILRDAYENLNVTLSATCSLSPELLNIGLSQQDLVIQYHHRLLQILKVLLLRKRVVVFGQQAKIVSNAVLSIASLLPGTLTSLLKGTTKDKDGYGFPLNVFSEPLSIQPYVCLQQMDLLMDKQSPCVIAGVVNPLFEKQKDKVCSIFVNLTDGLVTVEDPLLKSQLHLSSADLRFCSVLSKSMQRSPTSPTSPVESDGSKLQYSDWLGSNEWILAQFKLYLLSLLATSTSAHTPAMDDFNPEFMTVWMKSSTFTNWYESHGSGKDIGNVEPKHVCEGSLSLSDLKRRLVAQASDYGLNIQSREQVTSAVHQTQKALSSAVAGVWSSASSAVHHWWYPERDKNTTAKKENYS